LSALLANAIAIPSIGFIVVPLAISSSILLFISTELATGLLTLTQYVLTVIWSILTWLSAIPMTQWFIALPSLWVFAAMGIGILLLLAPAGWPGRWLSALWLLPLIFLPKQVPAHGQAWFTLLDVGQGLSVVVQTRHHVLVFDTGDKLSPQLNAGDAVVLPFLREMGIKKLDSLVISHDHSDHIGGANALLEQLEVSKIYSTALKQLPEDRTIACQYGQQWQWDGVDFKFLYPFVDADKMKRNDSCVLKISVGDKQLLLTGDIERAAEKALVNTVADELSADILVAPHHGSKTSSTPGFVAAVSAKTVLFPVGYLNRYNHPSPEVVQRYLDRGTMVYDSIRSGALHFILAEDDLKQPVQYRLERRRFWQQSQLPYDRRS
ncbi:MAG: DNA internalization-related competence protein ComEC/Rec2, partial [Gammaproteobacteria bacterium]